jgi:hypothetical protein
MLPCRIPNGRGVVENRRNEATDVSSLLDRNLRDTRQGLAALGSGGCIAGHEYFRFTRYV